MDLLLSPRKGRRWWSNELATTANAIRYIMGRRLAEPGALARSGVRRCTVKANTMLSELVFPAALHIAGRPAPSRSGWTAATRKAANLSSTAFVCRAGGA